MKIVICGSGLLGITTAFVLASRGHEVEVLERQQTSGAETSYANGGQLSYSHAEPWATPHVLKKLPFWMFKEDSPLIFRWRADPAMYLWGLQFLRNCTGARSRLNCVNLLRLGLYSRQKLHDIRAATAIEADFLEKGILHIYGSERDLEFAKKQADFQAKFGCEQRVLSAGEVMALEPALRDADKPIAGGIHSFLDESGDAHTFCTALAEYCTRHLNVTIRYGVHIGIPESDQDKITSIRTSEGPVKGDAYVMALGSYSPLSLSPLGIKIPVYPMKGYSLTVLANEHSPEISLTDGSCKIVYSRLGNRVRVAGTAEFAGHDPSVKESRISPILHAASTLFPKTDWQGEVQKWACLRPSTPDGLPYLGATPYRNLFLNTGHGTLGWTQAAGSAYIVADIIDNKAPDIMLSGMTLDRRST